MIALLSALGLGGVSLALVLMPGLRAVVFGVLSKLPWQAWATLAAAALLIGGWIWHGRAVESVRAAALAEGRAAEQRRWEQAFATMKQAADTWKSNYETAATALTEQRSARHAQDLRDIARRADDLRMRGPGRAAAPRCGSGIDSGLPPAAGQPERRPGGGGDPLPALPEPERLAILPWGRLVDLGEGHDAWRAEALTWRSWYLEQAELLRLRKREFPVPALSASD